MSFGPRWEPLLRKSPLFARELRQAGRSGGMFALVFLLALLLGLATFGISSALGLFRQAIQVGPLLFQIFFSLVYFGVVLLAPALAATGLASEKERRTWEALQLSGMNPSAVVWGKFWIALTAVLLFLAMTVPASVLCVLPGGVAIIEVVLAYLLLAVIGALGIVFGLSVGAWADTAASASMVAIAVSLVAAPILYFSAGVGLSFFAHATWLRVPSGSPVWLPLAYLRARFDGWYVLLLLALPAGIATLFSWFLFQVTRLRLSSESDDRARGLKIWFLAATPAAFAIATIPGIMTRGPSRETAWIGGLGGLFIFAAFTAWVFVGDALEPSRRVEFRFRLRSSQWFDRVLGPGLVQTMLIVLVVNVVSLALFALLGAAVLASDHARVFPPPPSSVALLTCGESWSTFLVFLIGCLAWLRVRMRSASAARVVTLIAATLAITAPFVTLVAFGYLAGDGGLVVASPSPLYAFIMARAIERGEPHLPLTAGLVCSLGWVGLGLTLFGLGARRATRQVAEQRTARAALDDLLANEEQLSRPGLS